jgi:pimeloyl-ACP methyl ester carboxylesterase
MITKIIKWTFTVFLAVVVIALITFYQPDIPVEELKKKYAHEPSQFKEVMGMNVHFRDEGNSNDTIPLVLLHGTSSSLFTWDACTSEWTKEHRVVRMDLPGFALTGPNPENEYGIPYYVNFVEEFLRSENIQFCYLAGNSLGGLIAYSYAATHLDQVKKVILIDPAGYPIENAKGSLAFKLGKIPALKNLLTIVTPEIIVRKSLEDAYGNKSLVTDNLVELYRDMTCREGNRNALLIRLNTDQQGDTTFIPKVMQPTLVIWGETDQLIPVNNAYKFQRDLPQDTLVVFPKTGHVPMEENPEWVTPLVSNFLKRN